MCPLRQHRICDSIIWQLGIFTYQYIVTFLSLVYFISDLLDLKKNYWDIWKFYLISFCGHLFYYGEYCCSVTQSSLCGSMGYSTPGFPVLHYLSEFAQTHVHWVNDAIQPSHTVSLFGPQSFPASGSFPVSRLFASGGQSIRASASTSVLPMHIPG